MKLIKGDTLPFVHDLSEIKNRLTSTRCGLTSVMLAATIWASHVTCPDCLTARGYA